ncbi:MAG: MMPL family transporter [Gammaproteobacteria bacterium]|nr:MMPL family transporter [Gammaproteobacteria bacterium]
MNELARKLDRWLASYGAWIIRWRWPVILGSLVLAMAAGYGAQNLAFKNDYRVFFSQDNPQLQAFEELQNVYVKNDIIIFVVTPESGDVFDTDTLVAMQELTEAAWTLPYSMRVDSLTNFQHTEALEDDLMVADLVEDPASMSAAEREEVRQIALAEPLLRDRLVALDSKVAGVAVTFQMPEKTPTEMPEAAAAARELVDQVLADHPGIDIKLTGSVMLNNAFFESSMNDSMTLVPAMYAIIILAMFLLLRSFPAVFATVLVILASVVTAMGMAGWSGIFLTPPSASAPTIITTLAVADAVHILVTMFGGLRKGMSRNEALIYSIRLNMQPVFLTSLTTAVGFLTMNFSDAPPFRDLGNITAMGVVAAWIFSVTLLPAVLSMMPLKARASGSAFNDKMEQLGDFVVARRKSLALLMFAVSAVVVAFIPNNELSDEFVRYFDTRVEFRTDSDYATENLTGIYQLQFSLPAGETGAIADPEYLARLGAFTDWLREQPEVTHVLSMSDTFKRLNKSMHGDDESWYRLPEQRDLAAQYLLLYEFSLPFGLDLNNQVSLDKSSTQLVATLKEIDSNAIKDVAARAENWLLDNAPSMHSYASGPAVMFSHISERNVKSMLTGTTVGIFVIALILIIALRSLSLGTLSLLPNLLPAALAFGVWGMFVGQINMAVSVVTGMSLGIVVDDSVHFLSKYLRARREEGLGAEAAVRYAFSSVGVALVVTTIILVAGFAVLAMSSFAINSSMAMLTSIAILLALVVDFLLLPPLLIWLDGHKERSEVALESGETA